MSYRDRTFCASEVEKHSCGRELSETEQVLAVRAGLPIAWGRFCEEITP
jgi:peroxiredoxin